MTVDNSITGNANQLSGSEPPKPTFQEKEKPQMNQLKNRWS